MQKYIIFSILHSNMSHSNNDNPESEKVCLGTSPGEIVSYLINQRDFMFLAPEMLLVFH